jgi:hypothetical protein
MKTALHDRETYEAQRTSSGYSIARKIKLTMSDGSDDILRQQLMAGEN